MIHHDLLAPDPPPAPAQLPCALTIAGLDPSGGAGICADLRGFSAAGVWGCAACAALTVQSTCGLRSVLPTPADNLRAQALEVLAHQRVRAIKTGALGSRENVLVALDILRAHPDLPSVVDPVMIATRAPGGARLLDPEALAAMRQLCSAATLITPNIDEAEALLEGRITSLDDQIEAASALLARGSGAVLIKGGHLPGERATDVLATRQPGQPPRLHAFHAARTQKNEFHGGGCLLAALAAGHLAAHPGDPLEHIVAAVLFAKQTLSGAIAGAASVGDGLLVPHTAPR